MKLNEQQLDAVSTWFAGGASLDEIQKRLVSEFGVHVTYFDLRMLVADLPQPAEPEADESEGSRSVATEDVQERVPPTSGAEPGGSRSNATDDEDAQERVPPEGAPEGSSLSVTVDALMIPGTMASGDVVFSDGVKGKWHLDQMGRLGLGGDLPKEYRPSPEDAALFQARLMEALRAKGLC